MDLYFGNKHPFSYPGYMYKTLSQRLVMIGAGDLMGDVISHAVLEGNDLFENNMLDAEEAVGNLAPTVQALLYLQRATLLYDVIRQKGKDHVAHRK